MMKFNEIDLPERILKSLEKINYSELTPIQEQIIPSILNENDVLGCSQTGSGKTGAFLIPILAKLIKDKTKKALIIAPTRELAMQIMDNVKIYANNDKNINKSLIIGGASIRDQLLSIKKGPRLIIGTPGRINDFLDSRKLNIADFNILVLDEMDRMLDMGFSAQIDEIIKNIAKKRQTMLFSATISKKIEKLIGKYLNNPTIVKIGSANQISSNINQEIIEIENNEKFEMLLNRLKADTVFTIVFVKTKFATERLAMKLDRENIMAKAIHGDMKQTKRAKIIQAFRNKKFNVLVATDIVARGLDIPHVDTVINYDLPQSPEDYIHRIGRCSRSLDSKGTSITFCNKNDKKLLLAIKSLIDNGEYLDEFGFKKAPKNIKKTADKPKINNKKGNMKNKEIENHKNKEEDKKGFYDIEALMNDKKVKVKRPSTYLIAKTSVSERRKRLGLDK